MSARAGVLVLLLGLAAPAAAQNLRSRVEGAPDGTVRMSFAAKPGVCGNGHNISHRGWRSGQDWEHDCESGPVRVVVEMNGGRPIEVRTYVGGRWRTPREGTRVTDLGMVGAAEAATWLLSLAERETERIRGDVILPAVLADSTEAWPVLLRIAKNQQVRNDTRKQAVFWLSQEAGEAATRGLAELVQDDDEDREIRKQAVFALSQLDNDRGVPELIKVARTHRDPQIRKNAIFWLGQSEDPRAIALFEELLTRRQ